MVKFISPLPSFYSPMYFRQRDASFSLDELSRNTKPTVLSPAEKDKIGGQVQVGLGYPLDHQHTS